MDREQLIFNYKAPEAEGLHLLKSERYLAIHEASLKVLEQTGIVVEDEHTRILFSDCGCIVEPDKHLVKIPAAITEAAIQSAPDKVWLHGRKTETDLHLDSRQPTSHFANFPSNINIVDLNTGRVRPSTKDDLIQMTRLCDAVEHLRFYSRAVYPLDVAPGLMHLHTAEACLKNTTKHSTHGPESAWETRQIIRMVEAITNNDKASAVRKPVSFVSSVISPLRLSTHFCDVVRTSAQNGFPTIIASAAIGGGTAPVHLAGLVVQTNAEILAGIVLAQLVKKHAPVIYACYSTGMDLKLGTSPLGSPEAALITSAVPRLCQLYGIPCQVPGLATDSLHSGTQAAFEKTLTGLASAMSGANLILGAGGVETGLTFDPAQAVLDEEIIRMIKFFQQGFSISEASLSPDIIHEVGHGGNFLSHPSTFTNMRSTSQTHLFNRTTREQWEKSGKPKSYFEAREKAKHLIGSHTPEKLPAPVEKEINQVLEEAEQSIKARS